MVSKTIELLWDDAPRSRLPDRYHQHSRPIATTRAGRSAHGAAYSAAHRTTTITIGYIR